MIKVIYAVANEWSMSVSCIYRRIMTLKEGSCVYVQVDGEDELYVTVTSSDGIDYRVYAFNLELI